MKPFENHTEFDVKLQKFNNLPFTEQESIESYQKIISRMGIVKKRKRFQFEFTRTVATCSTILVLISVGWLLNNILSSQTGNLGVESPLAITDKHNVDTTTNEKTTADPGETKAYLLNKTEQVFKHLMNKDWKEISTYLSSEHGLVYSPFSNVGDRDDLQFTKEEVEKLGEDETLYSWSWDQSNAEFLATPNDFVENLLKQRNGYVYNYDEITFNHSDTGTMVNTIHDTYPNALYVEYLDEPDPVTEADIWPLYQAIRFVYEKIDNEWYLVAIVRGAHNP